MNVSPNFGNIMADSAALNAARVLVPNYIYNLLRNDPIAAIKTGSGDCKDVALVLAALRPDAAFVRHVTKPVRGSWKAASAYIHYLVIDREVGIVMHSTGAPLNAPGAHIKATSIEDFGLGWSEDGEKRAKPSSAINALGAICAGSEHETRRFSGFEISMSVEDPQTRFNGGSMAELRDEALGSLVGVV